MDEFGKYEHNENKKPLANDLGAALYAARDFSGWEVPLEPGESDEDFIGRCKLYYEITMEPYRDALECMGLEIVEPSRSLRGDICLVDEEKFATGLVDLKEEEVPPYLLRYLQLTAQYAFEGAANKSIRNMREDNLRLTHEFPQYFDTRPIHFAGDMDKLYQHAAEIATSLAEMGGDQELAEKIYHYGECYKEGTHEIAAILDGRYMFATDSVRGLFNSIQPENLMPIVTFLNEHAPEGYLVRLLGENVDKGFVDYINSMVEIAETSVLKDDPALLAYLEKLEIYREQYNAQLQVSEPCPPPERLVELRATLLGVAFEGAAAATVESPRAAALIDYLQTAAWRTAERAKVSREECQRLSSGENYDRVDFLNFLNFRTDFINSEVAFAVECQREALYEAGISVEPYYETLGRISRNNRGEKIQKMDKKCRSFTVQLRSSERLAQTLTEITGTLPAEALEVFDRMVKKLRRDIQSEKGITNSPVNEALEGADVLADQFARLGGTPEMCNQLRLLKCVHKDGLQEDYWQLEKNLQIWKKEPYLQFDAVEAAIMAIKEKSPHGQTFSMMKQLLLEKVDHRLAASQGVTAIARKPLSSEDLHKMTADEINDYKTPLMAYDQLVDLKALYLKLL